MRDLGIVYRELAEQPLHATSQVPHPAPLVAGCALLGPEALLFSERSGNRALLVSTRFHAVSREIPDLLDPCGVSALPGGGAVIAEPRRSRLTLVSAQGEVRARIATPGIEPWHAAFFAGGWLVVDGRLESPAVRILDDRGRVLFTPALPYDPVCLRAAVPTASDRYLLCDRYAQRVLELSLSGEVVWSYGRLGGSPGASGCLTDPEHATPHPDGGFVICDTGNSRVLLVDRDGSQRMSWGGSHRVGGAPGCLWRPVAASVSAQGEIFVADARNGRIVKLAGATPERTLWGRSVAYRCLLQNPRCAEPDGDGYWVADSFHHRVVHIDGSNRITREYTQAEGRRLSLPRFATKLGPDLLVADSGNRRLVRFRASGEGAELPLGHDGRRFELGDLHSIRLCRDGMVLCDSAARRVALVRPDGRLLRVWGAPVTGCESRDVPLADPHDAVLVADGGMWIADTGNDRVVRIDRSGGAHEIRRLRRADGRDFGALAGPRSVDPVASGRLLVCDTGNDRVLVVTHAGVVEGCYGGEPGIAPGHLRDPRFARADGDRIVIVDFGNNRIVLLDMEEILLDAPPSRDALGSRARVQRSR